ncbi:MAG: hypothetical protein N3A71_01070 [Candidatus Dojkabacteria bacterium]|nr:hypothetical protein [Candidatus Dojkabacteria bacterium]
MERIKLNQMNKKSIFLAIGLLAILAIGSIILYLSFLQNQSSSGVVSENTESGKIDETSDSIDAKQTPFSELEKTDFEIDSNLRTVEGIKDNILNYIFGDEEFRNENFYSLMSDTINLALINKYDINAFVPRFD